MLKTEDRIGQKRPNCSHKRHSIREFMISRIPQTGYDIAPEKAESRTSGTKEEPALKALRSQHATSNQKDDN